MPFVIKSSSMVTYQVALPLADLPVADLQSLHLAGLGIRPDTLLDHRGLLRRFVPALRP